jgi:hypothetical protein
MSAQRSNKNSTVDLTGERRPPFSPARAGGDASLPPRGLAAMPAWTRSVCTLSAALQSGRLVQRDANTRDRRLARNCEILTGEARHVRVVSSTADVSDAFLLEPLAELAR